MVDINVEKYINAKVYTLRVGNKKLFWVRMHHVLEGMGVKNMSDLVSKEIRGIFKTKNPTKYQIRNTKDVKKNWILILLLLLCMFVVISCQE